MLLSPADGREGGYFLLKLLPGAYRQRVDSDHYRRGILGWLASKVMRTDAQQGIILHIVDGIVGAALAGFLLSPLLGIPTINAANFSIGGLLISFFGALILLAIVNLIRCGRAR